MPRLPRVHVKGVPYYVTQEGAHQKQLFKDKEDYEVYLKLLKEYKEKYGFKLYSYCLLPSKLHLVIEPSEEATISDVMRDLTSRYSKHYNGRYEGNGPLFQGRFKARFVEKESYLYNLTGYLHFIPKRRGFVEKPDDYEYSSHPSQDPADISAIADIQPLMQTELNEIKNYAPRDLEEDFLSHFSSPEFESSLESFESNLRKNILGSPSFIRKIKAEIEEASAAPVEIVEPVSVPVEASAAEMTVPAVSLNFKLIGAITVFSILGAVISIPYFYQQGMNRIQKEYKNAPQAAFVVKEPLKTANETKETKANKELVVVLSGTEWDVQLIPMDKSEESTVESDTLTFINNKLISANLAARGYRPANLTMTTNPETKKVTWETMQVGPNGEIVFWRGEWKNNEMTGVISKQFEGGKSQNFNFVGAVAGGSK